MAYRRSLTSGSVADRETNAAGQRMNVSQARYSTLAGPSERGLRPRPGHREAGWAGLRRRPLADEVEEKLDARGLECGVCVIRESFVRGSELHAPGLVGEKLHA